MKRKKFEDRSPSHQRNTALSRGLNARHRQLMRELAAGATYSQAAIRVGYTIQRVNQVVNSPIFLEEMARMEDFMDEKLTEVIVDDTVDVSSILRGAAKDAAKGLVDMSNSEDEKIKLSSIKDILDRTGHKAPAEVIASVTMDADDGLKHMLGEMAKEMGKETPDGEAD